MRHSPTMEHPPQEAVARWRAYVIERKESRLLTDGCESPLYNPDVHISELLATLHYLRGGREIQPVALD